MFPGETVLSGAKSSKEDKHVSELKVMSSAAGYYVGTTFTACDCETCKENDEIPGMEEPNTRETDYFRKYEDAKAALDKFNAVGDLDQKRT